MREKLFYLVVFLLVVLGSLLLVKSVSQIQEPLTSGDPQNIEESQAFRSVEGNNQENTFLVTKVVDGDTVEIQGGSRVRYIGVDTPETVDPREPVQCFGRQASEKNKELVEGKKVRLEKDVSETDRYGRLLRYVYTDQVFVNEVLVKEGYARASSFPPDVKYQKRLLEAERFARENNKGLWAACGSAQGVQTSENYHIYPLVGSSGCKIKGNISSNKEKIYHMPGQRYYDRTVIDESKGEHWFCTEEEAVKAGWRKSKV